MENLKCFFVWISKVSEVLVDWTLQDQNMNSYPSVVRQWDDFSRKIFILKHLRGMLQWCRTLHLNA